MKRMNESYARDLDLNLLRVFVVVAESQSVTHAAERLYLTQPAVSAALKRLTKAVGGPLFTRQGRGIVLTARGQRVLDRARPHLEGLLAAALSPAKFDPRSSDRVVRLGLSDPNESWLLPALLRALERRAPRLRLVVVEVQFRNVGEALASSRVDLAVTVADELPAGTSRKPLIEHGSAGGFVCLFDPRRLRLGKKPTLERYLACDHVIVSYNGDLRGIVEDLLGVQRKVKVSVPTFHALGPVVSGSALVATVPVLVAREITRVRPRLCVAPLPFRLSAATMELLARTAVLDDPAVRLVYDEIERVAREARG
jgi:LysR family transcriptional activator of mexEF-oprN operon